MKTSVLLQKADQYAHSVYRVGKRFPKSELFGLTSQLRRAALSVPLNIVEGFARHGTKELHQFFKISYASLQESQYLLEFSHREGYLDSHELNDVMDLGNEVARMLWVSLRTLRNKTS